jgi:hypothetical protein
MDIESIPLVVFLLLPGFLSWFIFCWGTVTRKISQIQHIFTSLIFSLFAFTLAYYLTYFVKFIGINVFSASWDIISYPKYMQILVDPKLLPSELWITIYSIAIVLGFLLIAIYKNQSFALMLNRIGLDLYGPEGVWYRLFHHSDFITVYLKDGNIITGWPTYYSQTGEKDNTELYLTKVRYFHENNWIKPDISVDGVLINTDSIQRIEFRKPKLIFDNRNKENLKAKPKSINNSIYNPLSLGILYFGFALSLWSSTQIGDSRIKGIAIFLTILSAIFFIAIYSEWVFRVLKKITKYLTLLTFFGFVYGFLIGWLQSLSDVSNTVLALVIYFGFAWFVTILLIQIKEIPSKRVRVFGTIIINAILLVLSITRFCKHEYFAGGILLVISLLMILVAIDWLKLHGSVYE